MGFLRAERAWKQGHVVPHNVYCVIVALPLTMFCEHERNQRNFHYNQYLLFNCAYDCDKSGMNLISTVAYWW